MKIALSDCMLMSGVLLLAGSAALAQPASHGPSLADKHFLHVAMGANMTEIEAAKIALQKAQSADVKAFAQQMIQDHTALGEKAGPVAESAGVKPPSTLPLASRQELAHLKAVSDQHFDAVFIRDMVKDHEGAAGLFKAEAKDGHDAQVKDLAKGALPTIEEHLDMIRQIEKAHHLNSAAK
jgi:putative membrane protein